MSKSQAHFRVKNRSVNSVRTHREDTSELIKDNKSRIEEMKKSNAVLREELDNERKVSERNSRQAEEAILKLQKEGVYYSQRINEELRKKEMIGQQIEQCKQQIERNRQLLNKPEGEKNSNLWYIFPYIGERSRIRRENLRRICRVTTRLYPLTRISECRSTI